VRRAFRYTQVQFMCRGKQKRRPKRHYPCWQNNMDNASDNYKENLNE